jgi:DNA-binding response OmpR family regulator
MEDENDILEHNLEMSYVGGKERILFVDDEETIAHVAEEMLEEMGYDTLATTNSLAALEAFRLQPDRFDIVITDQTMPGMTGMELAEEVLKIRPEIPIIVCTGLRESVHRNHAMISNIEAFIMKPFTMAELDATIRKVLLRRI